MVDQFFPPVAQPLARMVYGKRAASTLYALAETLQRRPTTWARRARPRRSMDADRDSDGDEAEADEAGWSTRARRRRAPSARRSRTSSARSDELSPDWRPSKWKRLIEDCLAANGIVPGNTEQAVIFTEYADSAEWIADRLKSEGFTARVYSGRQTHRERDEIRLAFMRGEFQIIVTTDAGNEGIDLQAAHVLVNYDIPWSLVRLEQRMGRIHRVGQTRDVFLYNLVASDTREGETLLDAARQLRERRERAARADVRQPLGGRRNHRRRLRQVANRPLRQRRGPQGSCDSRCAAGASLMTFSVLPARSRTPSVGSRARSTRSPR